MFRRRRRRRRGVFGVLVLCPVRVSRRRRGPSNSWVRAFFFSRPPAIGTVDKLVIFVVMFPIYGRMEKNEMNERTARLTGG